jgi:hypothetical protein
MRDEREREMRGARVGWGGEEVIARVAAFIAALAIFPPYIAGVVPFRSDGGTRPVSSARIGPGRGVTGGLIDGVTSGRTGGITDGRTGGRGAGGFF